MNAAHPTDLKALAQELDALQVERDMFAAWNKVDECPFYDRHWEVRGLIQDAPAADMAQLNIKARAALIALITDEDLDCEGKGSYRGIVLSILHDIRRLNDRRNSDVEEHRT